MPVEIEWRPEVGKKVESFFAASGYKEYVESALSFNRKLNEERKMRIPYIDGQTGVAQRHYNSQRIQRERMPGQKPGQVYSYPQRQWKKKKYQYLKYFMYPRRLVDRDVSEMINISQMENSNSGSGIGIGGLLNEDSNPAVGGVKDDLSKEWGGYYDDMFQEHDEADFNSDSDFEYDDSYSNKKKKGGKKYKPKDKNRSFGGFNQTGGFGGSKRRSHADSIPDSEKPFHCEYCGIRYKTRPGLTYHIKTSHKDKVGEDGKVYINPIQIAPVIKDDYSQDSHSMGHSSNSGHSLTQLSAPPKTTFTELSAPPPVIPPIVKPVDDASNAARGRRVGLPNYNEDAQAIENEDSNDQPAEAEVKKPVKKVMGPDGKERAVSLGYCDFCLGNGTENKKTNKPEELVSCAECGRSGHPTCLQFTENMLISVRKYEWQCIECKYCSICGTAENDDQLLFCDDCDRGYHMYCLTPKIKEPPEGSWSCKLCIDTFHS